MKLNKKIIIVLLIILLIYGSIIFLLRGNTQIKKNDINDKDKIISLQNEKIKELENKLNQEKLNGKKNDTIEAKNNKDNNVWKNDLNDKNNNIEEKSINNKNKLNKKENIGNNLDLDKLFEDAKKYYKNQEYRKAIEKLKLYLSVKKESYNVFENLAKSYWYIGEYDKAVKIYKDLITKKPDNSGYYGKLGILFDYKKEKEKSSLFYMIGYLLNGKEFSDKDLKNKILKKMYDLEYKTIKEFINNKEYEDLRKYIFNKYLGEKNDEYDLEDNFIDENSNINNKDNFINAGEIYDLAVKEADEGNVEESIKLYKKYITITSKTKIIRNQSSLAGAWNNLGFNYKKIKDSDAEIVCFMLAKAIGTRYDQTLNAIQNQKKIINQEQETIDEFINNEEYEELRKYIFNKYLGEKNDEYDLEDNVN